MYIAIILYENKSWKYKMENNRILNERVKTSLATSDFYYDLPEELIAQSPSDERDGCRLMVLDRESGEIEHKIFRDIIDYLRPEDMLVVNSSKVIPARLLGKTDKTGGDMELLLLRMLDNGEWETLVRPGKRAKVGASFNFSDILHATVTSIVDGGNRTVKFEYDTEKYKNIYEVLDAIGNMPLPTSQRSLRTKRITRPYMLRRRALPQLPQQVCILPTSCLKGSRQRVLATVR